MAAKFSEAELTAMTVLLSRVVEGENIKKEIDEQRKILDESYDAAEKQRATAYAAFAVFGFDMSTDKPWGAVREAMGKAWQDGVQLARNRLSAAHKANPIAKEDVKESVPQAEPEKDEDQSAEDDAPSVQPQPTIREIVIAQLSAAGEIGVKAAEVRKYIELTYNQTVHEKTVGMTLYRLSKDGFARRDGRTWFSAKPEAEAENPGVDAPGSEESAFS
ncbi:hypothetical protein NKI36_01620 [Mesorhizobium caraganae]|uniref:HTH HARE-type domain-containing protein n=1 Tax=Mesorhizobium caraganae TaxID=483206 RepID=A0ABV1YTC3_9HYPH